MFSLMRPIALYNILGLPLLAWSGLLVLALFLFIEYIGRRNIKGDLRIPVVWHPRLAILAILMAILHALFGLSLFLK